MADAASDKPMLFAVLAEAKNYERHLVMTDLPFARVIDDIVVPYEDKKPFFIDGLPVKRDDIKRIKILRQDDRFRAVFADFHWRMRFLKPAETEVLGAQYNVRVEAILRECGEDVTTQVLKAFNSGIRPKLSESLTQHPELIEAGFRLFVEALKRLGGA